MSVALRSCFQALALAAILAAACSSETESAAPQSDGGSQTGGNSHSGGRSATGGSASGGRATGGKASTGGARSDASAGTGGANAGGSAGAGGTSTDAGNGTGGANVDGGDGRADAAVAPECIGKQGGDVVCVGKDRVKCSADLTRTSPVDTCSSTQTCTAGECLDCAPGKADCDSVATDCETNLDLPAACGKTCGSTRACTSTELCSGGCYSTGPSCAGLADDCGPASNESCCTSLFVRGGTFYRGYDGVSFNDKSAPITVSDFRLDRFQITVGRFRKFVAAWDGGWRPTAGSGKHSHLNGGKGLRNANAPDSGSDYEVGWDPAWESDIPMDSGSWDTALACQLAKWQTWTSAAGSGETRSINCASWHQLAAFCVWDGGFLPSEAEWNYAAAGGHLQRVYAWSDPPTSKTIDCSYANFFAGTTGCAGAPNAVGSESPKGDGYYGHADLTGNVFEFTLDWYVAPYPSCPGGADCASLTAPATNPQVVVKGGGFGDDANTVYTAYRNNTTPYGGGSDYGARCARAP